MWSQVMYGGVLYVAYRRHRGMFNRWQAPVRPTARGGPHARDVATRVHRGVLRSDPSSWDRGGTPNDLRVERCEGRHGDATPSGEVQHLGSHLTLEAICPAQRLP